MRIFAIWKNGKLLSSEYLFRRPWLTVRRDCLQLPTGAINDEYYVLEYPVWVNVIAITRDGRFVMVEQYRHGLQEIFTELVAGVGEPGETPCRQLSASFLRKPASGAAHGP